MFTKHHVKQITFVLACFAIASGCSSTTAQIPAKVDNAYAIGQRIDTNCITQVTEREQAVQASNSPAQFMALANQATRCIENIRFFPSHPDKQLAMRFNALAVVNFVKSGDITAAKDSLAQFKRRFAQQDLVFDDYTSFIDTATALLEPDLSSRQLAMLNINPVLRGELTRARQWALQ
ncbi:hypothetical protein ACFO4O_05580 [Glaciecola siphonariae]|uniref:DUF3015 domain-containing protein n=1 Tax=Glaciecola siphonariae TaxID=521012 RepID=A0ABV9LVI2_9ALTE